MSLTKQIYLENGTVIAKVLDTSTTTPVVCDTKKWCTHMDEPIYYLWKSDTFKLEYFFKEAHKWADDVINLITKYKN